MPSSLPDGAAQTSFIQSSDDTPDLTVAFYNLGIQVKEAGNRNWENRKEALKHDIVDAFTLHCLDMLCLSELGDKRRAC